MPKQEEANLEDTLAANDHTNAPTPANSNSNSNSN